MGNVTLKTVAIEAGVSPSAVSRILRGDKTCYIAETKKRTIFEVAEKLKYTPNLSARNLALRRTSNIAFVTDRLSSLQKYALYTFSLLGGLQKGLSEKGYITSVITVPCQNLESLEKVCSATKMYDGLVFGCGIISEACAETVAKAKVPAIILDDNCPFLDSISRVVTDKQGGITKAISYLKNLGHKGIAFYGFGEHLEMFKAGMAENGFPFKEEISFSSEDIYHFIIDAYLSADVLLENILKFTAVFCANDFVALGLCQRLREEKIEVGKDISIVGFDDVEALLGVEEEKRYLTTVRKPTKEIGEKGARLLIQMMESRNRTVTMENIPCHLVIRQSTARPRGR